MASYDVVIIDEAYHCMEIGGDDRDASLRRKLAELLARHSALSLRQMWRSL